MTAKEKQQAIAEEKNPDEIMIQEPANAEASEEESANAATEIDYDSLDEIPGRYDDDDLTTSLEDADSSRKMAMFAIALFVTGVLAIAVGVITHKKRN